MATELNFIIEKIKSRTPQWILDARDNKKDYEALVLGKDFHDLLNKVEHRESEQQLNVRKKYSRNVVDLFSRVFRNVDNIYCANGGIIDIEVQDKEKFYKARSNVRKGTGLAKWLETNWAKRLYNTDPNGLLMFDYCQEKDHSEITYKSINSIKEYEPDGQFVKWVLFEPIKKENYNEWLFVDSEKYYVLKQNGETVTLDEDDVIANPYRIVPACIISDIEQFGTLERLPKIHEIIPIAKEFLKDQSIKTIFKQLHGYPLFWRYAVPCPHCKGEGKINAEKCPHCDGQGYFVRKDISDGVILPVPSSENSIKLAPDMAGYIVPPLNIWEQYNLELKFLEAIIYETLWGDYNNTDTTKTVIEVVTNAQPVINALNNYADSAQLIDYTLSEILASILYPTLNIEKQYVTVSYGRNFILEAVSDLLKRYHEDKTAGDNSAILDRDLYEWVHAKFKYNPVMLKRELKRLEVEPYIHFTIEQINSILGNEQAQKKILFAEFWKSYDFENKSNDTINNDFNNYINQLKPRENDTV